MMDISKYCDVSLVSFLEVETRDQVLKALIDNLEFAGKLVDKYQFNKAILERENIVSTGIGMGVAVPHAKLSDYDDFFIAIGILKKGVDWSSLDGSPVRLVFMIGGPDDKQTEYLQILSSLTQIIKDESNRKKILTMNSPDAIIALFRNNSAIS